MEIEINEVNESNQIKQLQDQIDNIFSIYKNKTVKELSEIFDNNSNSKSINRLLIEEVVKKNEKLIDLIEKNNMTIKTITLNEKGISNESMSFSAFKYEDITNQNWENSDLYFFFKNTYFIFSIFQETESNVNFKGIKVYKIPEKELNTEIKETWNHTKEIIKSGNIVKNIRYNRRFTNFKGTKYTNIVHVRPHARDSNDTYPLPVKDKTTGLKSYMKHSFWLNSSYITGVANSYLKDSNSKQKLSNSKIQDKPYIYTTNNEKCGEGYIYNNHICYYNEFNNYKDAFLQEVIKNSYYNNSNIINEKVVNEFEVLKNKRIVYHINKNDYLTAKFFIKMGFTYVESTSIIDKLHLLDGKEPILKSFFIKILKNEQNYTQLKDILLLKELNFDEEIYVLRDEKFNNVEAVKFIVTIYNKIFLDDLVKKCTQLLDKDLTVNQVKTAIYNANLYYDGIFEKVFLDKNNYYKFVWK